MAMALQRSWRMYVAPAAAQFAVQNIRNYFVRLVYLKKIRAHAETISYRLRELDTADLDKWVEGALWLAKEAAAYRNAMLDESRNRQSTASCYFSKWMKDGGIKFDELVSRYQVKLGFIAPFNELEPLQKVQVYDEIISASGRGFPIMNTTSRWLGILGAVVLAFVIALVVWDALASEHHRATLLTNIFTMVGGLLGATLGEALSSRLAIAVGLDAPSSKKFLQGAFELQENPLFLGEPDTPSHSITLPPKKGSNSGPGWVLLCTVLGGFAGAFLVGLAVSALCSVIYGRLTGG